MTHKSWFITAKVINSNTEEMNYSRLKLLLMQKWCSKVLYQTLVKLILALHQNPKLETQKKKRKLISQSHTTGERNTHNASSQLDLSPTVSPPIAQPLTPCRPWVSQRIRFAWLITPLLDYLHKRSLTVMSTILDAMVVSSTRSWSGEELRGSSLRNVCHILDLGMNVKSIILNQICAELKVRFTDSMIIASHINPKISWEKFTKTGQSLPKWLHLQIS